MIFDGLNASQLIIFTSTVLIIELTNVCIRSSLREKCPNTEFFLVRIFPHFD